MKKKFILPAMMLAAAFASCTNDNEPSLESRSTLGVNVCVNQMSRAGLVYGTELAEGSLISVNVTGTDGSAYDSKTTGYLNVCYQATGSGANQKWGVVNGSDVSLSGTQGIVYGYYPWTDGVDYKAIAVNVTDQTDWMWANNSYTVSDASPSVDLVFNHVQTAVNVQVTRDESYTGAGLIQNLAVTSAGFASTGTFNVVDKAFASTSGASTAIVIAEDFTLVADDATTTDVTENVKENLYMLVPVSGVKDNFTITATIDGKGYEVAVSMGDSFTGYEAGKIYKINVTLGNTGLVVNSVAVAVDWKETTLSGGTLVPTT